MNAPVPPTGYLIPPSVDEFGRSWFAVYAASRHEKRVAGHLAQRGIEHFLPLYAARHRWKNGMTVDLQLPLFPGYLFARFSDQTERVKILQVPGVFSIVGGPAYESATIPDSVIEGLRQGLELRRIEPHHGIEIGKSVRIRSGLMAGMSGILTRRRSNLRVVVTFSQMMQSISVEVDETLVEPLPAGVASSAGEDSASLRHRGPHREYAV